LRVTVSTSRSVPSTGSGACSTARIARATRIPGNTGLPDPMNASSAVAGFSCRNNSTSPLCCVRICILRHKSCSGVQSNDAISVSSSSSKVSSSRARASSVSGIEYRGSRHHGTKIVVYVSPVDGSPAPSHAEIHRR
jgi:hypothetical protein